VEHFHVQIHPLLDELQIFHYTRHRCARRIDQFHRSDVGTFVLQVTVVDGVRVLGIVVL
jgi:hypothetical protein